MKMVYIGHYEHGSTSGMRGEHLRKLLHPEKFIVADVSIPIQATNKLFRSIGWRFYIGSLISKVNNFCHDLLKDENDIDLVWVDKGVFLKPAFIQQLKRRTAKLVHFTPDTAFVHNKSALFYGGMPYYDYCITTKSFEIKDYKKAGAKNILYCTQGYDPRIHKPAVNTKNKSGVAFAGLCEPYREEVVSKLLEAGVPVKIAGSNWDRFAKKHANNHLLQYLGNGLFGEAYASFYGESLVGLGLLSKKFPELHTTRLFEIPACGTALVTERNVETTEFFTEDDVIFYSDIKEMVQRIQYALANPEYVAVISKNGNKKVLAGGYDYSSIMRSLLKQIGTLS
jgi:spore maturation protein CgeB